MAWNPGTLRKSVHDAWLAGICGGLGEYTPVPTWLWRAAFIVTGLAGWGVVAYVVLWFLMPPGGFAHGDRARPGAAGPHPPS